MPHIAVKLWPGRSEEENVPSPAPSRTMPPGISTRTRRVSVSIEEIEPEAWEETVVRPEILEKPDIQYVSREV